MPRKLPLINNYRHVRKENRLFKYIMDKQGFTQDAQLARFLYTSTSIISQVRNERVNLSPRLILRIYDKMKLSIEEIRKMAKEEVK